MYCFPIVSVLKDEPDDLTHLAPVAGDVCIPLADHPFLSDILLDEILFSPLLDDPTDPFISYRSSCNASPQLLSPNPSKVMYRVSIKINITYDTIDTDLNDLLLYK